MSTSFRLIWSVQESQVIEKPINEHYARKHHESRRKQAIHADRRKTIRNFYDEIIAGYGGICQRIVTTDYECTELRQNLFRDINNR